MDFQALLIHNDNDLIVLNKPPGMLSQNDKSGDISVVKIVEDHLSKPVHLINRLDRPASGVIMLTPNADLCAEIQNMWHENKVKKYYTAVVEGILNSKTGTLTHLIKKGRSEKAILHKKGKKSVLEYEVISKLHNYSVLRINLVTGRFHQIRLQLSTINHPIKGDVKYGARRKNKNRSIYLHCRKIALENYPEFVAPYPTEDTIWKIVADL